MGIFASQKLQVTCLILFIALLPLPALFVIQSNYHYKNTHNASLLAVNDDSESVLSIQPSPIKTVFVIMMSHQNWSTITRSKSAAYLTQSILPRASYANNYFPASSSEEGNYLWTETGTDFGLQSDKYQNETQHVTTMLSAKGITWKAYQEGIDGQSCPLTASGLYTPTHNPMLYFNDVTDNRSDVSENCILHVRPFSELSSDLVHDTVSQYNFITPNLCDDMNQTKDCATPDAINNGDTWLATIVTQIINSQAYQNGGVVFITWDKGNKVNDPIGMIVLSPYAKGNGYTNTIHYTHSSLLKTVEEIFDVQPLVGDAGNQNTNDLSDLFISVGLTTAPQKIASIAAITAVAPSKIPTPTVTIIPTVTPTPTIESTPLVINISSAMTTNTPTPTVHPSRKPVISKKPTTTPKPKVVTMRSPKWLVYQSGTIVRPAEFSFEYENGWHVIYRQVNNSLAFLFYPAGSLSPSRKATDAPSGTEKEQLAIDLYQPASTIDNFIATNFPQYKDRLTYAVFGQIGNKTMYQLSLPAGDPDADSFGVHGIVLGTHHAYDIGFKDVMDKSTVDEIGTMIWPTFVFQ